MQDSASQRRHLEHRRSRRSGKGLLAAVLVVSSAGCASHNSQPSGHVNSLGCYTGPQRLKVGASPARPGEVVGVAATGPWHVSDVTHDVTTSSYGLFGTEGAGRFETLYYVAAIAPGLKSERNVRFSPAAGIGGVGLPNRPFQIKVPPVRKGKYLLKFEYSVAAGPAGTGPKTYNLCAPIIVSS